MQAETEVPSEARHLIGHSVFEDRELSLLRFGVIDFMKGKMKDAVYDRYVKWKRAAGEVAVLTAYAYADLPLPKTYDTIFVYKEPTNVIYVPYTITQAVFNGWTAIDHLSHGHKHVIVLQFLGGVPSICGRLPAFRVDHGWDFSGPWGFCDSQDYPAICDKLSLDRIVS